MERYKWWKYERARKRRLRNPSSAEEKFIAIMGKWFFFRYGVRREYKVYYKFKPFPKWRALDFAIPRYRIDIEIDSVYHKDHVADWERDKQLDKLGWTTVRVHTTELGNPEKVKKKVYRAIRG